VWGVNVPHPRLPHSAPRVYFHPQKLSHAVGRLIFFVCFGSPSFAISRRFSEYGPGLAVGPKVELLAHAPFPDPHTFLTDDPLVTLRHLVGVFCHAPPRASGGLCAPLALRCHLSNEGVPLALPFWLILYFSGFDLDCRFCHSHILGFFAADPKEKAIHPFCHSTLACLSLWRIFPAI